MQISIDTSLPAHALLPHQSTQEAADALLAMVTGNDALFGAASVFVEFPSLLRRSVTQRTLDQDRAAAIFQHFVALAIEPVLPTIALQERSWAIASRLGQSDTFDAMGYAVAEAIEGEFWTSDRRFANSAAGAGLSRVRFVP